MWSELSTCPAYSSSTDVNNLNAYSISNLRKTESVYVLIRFEHDISPDMCKEIDIFFVGSSSVMFC